MVMSLIGYGLTKAARTDLVASTGLEGMDLPRYRTAIQTAREHAVRAWSAGEVGGIADGDIARPGKTGWCVSGEQQAPHPSPDLAAGQVDSVI